MLSSLPMNYFIISVIALSSLFILNITVGLYYSFGIRHYWFFELEHVLGGFFVAMFLKSFTDSNKLILIGLMAITLIWELAEIIIPKAPALAAHMKNKLRLTQKEIAYSWADGAFDLVCNYIGAIIFIYLSR